MTHDASFQTADRNNKDYRYNLAASVLADMLGLEDALPVYVEREWRGRLKNLNGHQLENKTKGYLTKSEVQALMARRDKILAYFKGLIAEKGENAVLF